MTASSQSMAVALADAMRAEVTRAGAADPKVHGADWRLAVVDTVNAGGTVTTTDGIIAKRVQSYRGPLAGDVIVVSISGAGSWIALGRLASTANAWTAITLSSGWSPQALYYVPAYRINGDGTASLSGMGSMSGSLSSGTVVATLPAEARPAAQVRCAVQVAIGYFGVMTIATNGNITLGDFNPTLPGTGSKYAQFDVLSNYRLA